MKEQKIWFRAFNSRLWLPVSVEGWVVTAVVALLLFVIVKVNKVSNDVPFVLSRHWPMLAELIIVMVALHFVTKGHVDKRY